MSLETLRAYFWPLDLRVLHYLNVEMAGPEGDRFWHAVTHLHKEDWFRFGVMPVLLLFLVHRYRWHVLKPLLALALAVGISDLFCYRGLKSVVHRPRPFENAEIAGWLRKVGDAHGPSFPSNHAANTFAGAVVLAWYFRRSRILFYGLATLVAVSRPALGVHYPSDVLAGALLGLVVGVLVRGLVLTRFPWFRLPDFILEGETPAAVWSLRSVRPDEREASKAKKERPVSF